MAEQQYVQVQTTVDSREEASRLSRAVVDERLAACAKVLGPISSTYWWEDTVDVDEEWLVLINAPSDRYEPLAAYLTREHPYDVPEILAFPVVAGGRDYLAWVSDETRAARTEPI
ncbi:MAG: divalent-cation tolerance protein CutA [Streptosporangiaceae bacterium]